MLKKTTRGMTAAMTRRGVGFAVAGGGPSYDTDAQAYITLVEAADSQSLETGVKDAINAFVVGCKTDGIWDAIKAACIMAGARTLDGALQPLVGTAPQPYNFVSGDYNRETGLVGDGATKYLDSNRAGNADPQNNVHLSVYITQTRQTWLIGYIGANATNFYMMGSTTGFRARINQSNTSNCGNGTTLPSIIACSRSNAAGFDYRGLGESGSVAIASAGVATTNTCVYGRGTSSLCDSRLSFYSIGESLDLALLDSRVSTLMTAIGAAIP
jgi:hypothetical protein